MELILPNNCVEIENEEMMYLDGGATYRLGTISARNCRAIAIGVAGTAQGLISLSLSLVLLRKVVNKVANFGGLWGWAMKLAWGYCTVKLCHFAYNIGSAALKNKKVSVEFDTNPWSFGITSSIC